MPKFLGHEVSDDAASVSERALSKSGFSTNDEPLLVDLKVLETVKGQQRVNPNLAPSPVEIRDFMRWLAGKRAPPLPPLARRILCLKRATIMNSIQSANTAANPAPAKRRILKRLMLSYVAQA